MHRHDRQSVNLDPYRITADRGDLPLFQAFVSDVRFWTGMLIGILLTAAIS